MEKKLKYLNKIPLTKTNAQSDIGLTSVNIFTNFIYALKCLGEILREILTCTRNESYCLSLLGVVISIETRQLLLLYYIITKTLY